jgi:hypothetical protein
MCGILYVIIADLAREVGILFLLHNHLGLIGTILAIEVLIVGRATWMVVAEGTL